MKATPALLLLLGAGVAAADEPVRCTLDDLERTVQVVYAEPGQAVPCEVLYDKPAEDARETPWRAEQEAGFCERKAEELVAELEALGWRCGPSEGSGAEPGI